VSDNTKNATAPSVVKVVASNATLKGQYAFLVNGQDRDGFYAAVGSLTFDGNGNITTGEEDLASFRFIDLTEPATGTYTVGPDGRGSMSIFLAISKTTQTFGLTVTSNSHVLMNEDDGTETSSGTLDLQSVGPFSASQISGGYSFTLTGTDVTGTILKPVVFGGIFNADGVGQFNNGTRDANDAGTSSSASFTATFTAPDSNNGRGTIASSTGSTFVYYIVSKNVIRLVETDENVFTFVAGGTAYGQGPAATFANSSLNGRFVFNDVGQSTQGSFAGAGQFVADGTGKITAGLADVNNAGVVASGSLAGSTYAFNNSPRGTLTIPAGPLSASGANLLVYVTDPSINLLDPNNTSGKGGALVLDNDATVFGVGVIIPQVSPTVSQTQNNYALAMSSGFGSAAEIDLTGQMVANLSANLNGSADYASSTNSSSTAQTTNIPCTGSFVPDTNNAGHLTGTILLKGGTLDFVSGGGVQNLSYYQASDSQAFIVEIDGNVSSGVLVKQ
jgi:hypothetical protein